MALARGRRTDRRIDYWPGFVDALSTLLLAIMFLLTVFVLAQFLLGAVNNEIVHLGWGQIPDVESRSLQMRVFVLGLVISLALRYAPRGLIPEVAQITR